MGFGRPAMEETDFHQQEEDRWARARTLGRSVPDSERSTKGSRASCSGV
jgi:hypothetical protein